MAQEEARYERNPDYIFRKIVDELVLVPVRQNVADMDCIYTLNAVGAFVWERLYQPATQAELLAAVVAEYETEPEIAAADLEDFMREMMAADAVRRV